jgi:bifunctional pyridoxal-dependent enzyme with beta-cystathionase and maltose regulon repressor activities
MEEEGIEFKMWRSENGDVLPFRVSDLDSLLVIGIDIDIQRQIQADSGYTTGMI